jgi:hypothetical protein
MEFMALANHRKEMRAEIAYYAERFREVQRQAVTAELQRYGMDSQMCRRWCGRYSWSACRGFWCSSGRLHVWRVRGNLRVGRELPAPPGRRATAKVVHELRSEQSTPWAPSLDTTTTPSTARSQ